jgi:hypothetical protein
MENVKIVINDNRYVEMEYDENKSAKEQMRKLLNKVEDEVRKELNLPSVFEEVVKENCIKNFKK